MSASQETPVYLTTSSGQKLAIHANWIIFTANLLSDWLRLMHQGFELQLKTLPAVIEATDGTNIQPSRVQADLINTMCATVEGTLSDLLPHIIQASHVNLQQLDNPQKREDVLSTLLLPEPSKNQTTDSPTAQDHLTHSIQQAIELVRTACHSVPSAWQGVDASSVSEQLETVAQQAFQRAMGAENIIGSEALEINAAASEALKTAFSKLQDHIAPEGATETSLAPLGQRFLTLYEGAMLQTVLHMQGMMLPEDGGEAFQTAGNVLANFGMLQTSWEDLNRLALSSNPQMALAQEVFVITNTLGKDLESDGQIKETVCTSFQIAADKPPSTPLSPEEDTALSAARRIMSARLYAAERDLHRFISSAPAPQTKEPKSKNLSGIYN